jgi:hypothetical protein
MSGSCGHRVRQHHGDHDCAHPSECSPDWAPGRRRVEQLEWYLSDLEEVLAQLREELTEHARDESSCA